MSTKTTRYKMKHSGAGCGSACYGMNQPKEASRPSFATHGTAPHKSVPTKSGAGSADTKPYNRVGRGRMYDGSGNGGV